MEIRLIIAQYPQQYDGQYMPNVVDAWDEYAMDGNEEGYAEALAKHQAKLGIDYEAVRELTVTVPDQVVTDLFVVPELPTLWKQVDP